MARTCAFCGKGELTKEHLFAKWGRDIFHSQRVGTVFKFERSESVLWSYGGSSALEQTVKAFCAKCNNGWMSQLEVKASKIMRPMLRAEIIGPVTMRYTQQAIASSWALKTALVVQQLHTADNRVPTSEYRNFQRRQEPSSNVLITMGSRHVAGNSEGANIFEHKERFVGDASKGIQHIHFALGAVYFGIAVFVGMKRRYPLLSNDIGTRINLIWPSVPKVTWPVFSITDVGGVEGMFDAMTSAPWVGPKL